MSTITQLENVPTRGAGNVGTSNQGHGRLNRSLLAGLIILVVLVLAAIVVPLVSRHGTTQIGNTPFAGPSVNHLLGTDNLGRDTFTRITQAARTGLLISFASSILAATLGGTAGIVAGYRGGLADNLVMRAVDVLMAIPPILLALLVRVMFGTGTLPLIISLGIICAPGFARIMRAPIMVLRERDFVVAAEVTGVRKPIIAIRHLLPNALTPMLVQFAATASEVVLLEAVLSYLGQGVQPPEPSAGRMIAEFTRYMQQSPSLVLVPAVLIVAMTFGWNLLADGLQSHLAPSQNDVSLTARRSPIVRLVAPAAEFLNAADGLQRKSAETDAAAIVDGATSRFDRPIPSKENSL